MRTKKELSITGDQNGLVSNRKSNSWFTRMLSSSCVALTVIMSQSALADQKQLVGDDFKLIQTSIDMQEKSVLLPVPKYKFVDIAGKYKNAPDSKACGGNVSEGDTLLRSEAMSVISLK